MKKMSLAKRIVLIILCLAACIGLIWLANYLIRYHFYDDYKDYLSSYEFEDGTEFVALKDDLKKVSGMELVAENENLMLYTDTKSASIAIYDKRNGETVYSNPLGAEEDALANKTNKDYLKSQFIINYYNSARVMGTYDSYSMSVAREQVEVQSIPNGLRYIYTVGDFSQASTGIVPIFMSPEKLAEIQTFLSEADAKAIARYYREDAKNKDILTLNNIAQKNAKTLEKITGFLEQAGFTEDDYTEQMSLAGVEVSVPISFVIPVEYRLEADGVNVSVPTRAIEENGGAKLWRIQLLRYFGAAGLDETGYMVVPNGSGSIINFNNGKSKTGNYGQYVYGIDPMIADYELIENTEQAKLPLFGISKDEQGILATIEDGASLCQITAAVSGSQNSYNYVFPTFLVRGYDILAMFGSTGNEADLPLVEKNIYDVNLTMKYTMLTKENSDYSGMANYYRNRLLEEGKLTLNEKEENIPFYYDVLGGVKQTAFILGAQYLRVYAMTTFDEAKEIFKDLLDNGINNQVMNYQGWCNGGFYHDVLDKVKITGKLGGKSDLEDLSETVTENGGRFYVDNAFQQVSFISKRYKYAFETSKYYGAGYIAYFGQVNPGTLTKTSSLGYEETMYDLLSPKFLPRYIEKFSNKIQKIDVAGVSLRDLGDQLHSDKKRTNVIDREQALDVVIGQLDILADTNKNIMVNSGNDYSFKYATDIINAPITDNKFFIVDADIPFYEMVIHGSIDYSSKLLNFQDSMDNQKVILNMIEYGASPHYVFTHESSNELKNTGLNRYYSTQYTDWKTEAIDVYNKVNDALSIVSGEVIVQHEILENNIRRITYSNGVVIYVNYNASTVTIGELQIPANDYLVVMIH